MSEEMKMPEGLGEVEGLLRGMKPAASGVEPVAVVWEAGRAEGLRAGRKVLRAWQGLAGVLVGVSVSLGVVAGMGGGKTVEREVVREVAAPATGSVGVHEGVWVTSEDARGERLGAYLKMRNAVLIQGGRTDGHGGGGERVTPLKSSDGLDALPEWQRQAVLFPGARS